MEDKRKEKKGRKIIRWIAWVLLAQVILINISAALYGYKLTYYYNLPSKPIPPSSQNVFAKTWHLFRAPRYFRLPVTETPECPYDTVTLFTKNNIPIRGWYMPVDSARGTVLIFHGLGGNKETMLGSAYLFRDMNYNVMMIDYRAHGSSGGHICTYGVKESEEAKLAYDFVKQKGEKNIILYGTSLGAVVVAKAVYDYGLAPSHIIMDMPFASLRDHFRGRARVLGFPSEPFGTLVTFWAGVERGFNGFNHNTCRYVKKIHCPVLMEYGTLDKLVLKSETDCVFNNIASPDKKLVAYEDEGHSFFFKTDPIKWKREMENFLGIPQQ